MEITLKNLSLADGSFFERVETTVPDTFLEGFIPLKDGNDKIYIDPEYIISFEVEEKRSTPKLMVLRK